MAGDRWHSSTTAVPLIQVESSISLVSGTRLNKYLQKTWQVLFLVIVVGCSGASAAEEEKKPSQKMCGISCSSVFPFGVGGADNALFSGEWNKVVARRYTIDR